MKDLTGQVFGRLRVIEEAPRPEGVTHKATWWKCLCECGNEKPIRGDRLRFGYTQSCGCLGRGREVEDLTGQVFGRLRIIGQTPRPEGTGVRPLWECLCECGNKKIAQAGRLKNGSTQSCGCLRREVSSQRMRVRHAASRARVCKLPLSNP